MRKKIPRGQYGPDRDGLLDPEMHTPGERYTTSETRLNEQKDRRTSPSPFIRKLQAAADKALNQRK